MGAHEHGTTPPASGDIVSANIPPESQGDFSAARSGSLFASPAYRDPYSEEAAEDLGALSPSSRNRGQSFADRLGHVFSASPKQAHPPFDFEPPEVRSPPLSATKQRFAALSPFRGGGRDRSSERKSSGEQEHRVPHPRGPRDMQARDEEEALFYKNDDAFDDKSDDEHVHMGGRVEQYDSRDEL